MMKRRVVSTKRKTKYSRQEWLINIIVAALFGGTLIWITYNIFQTARTDNQEKEGYMSSLPSLQDTIPHEKVCMVDDIYQGEFHTVPVMLGHKTYYGCDYKAMNDLRVDQKLRVAKDPISNREVDKALSFIALHPKRHGKVLYFESKETYSQFLSDLRMKNKSKQMK